MYTGCVRFSGVILVGVEWRLVELDDVGGVRLSGRYNGMRSYAVRNLDVRGDGVGHCVL